MPTGISGLTSDFDSQKLIEKLIEVEKQPIKRMQDEKEIINLRIDVLHAFESELVRLRDSVKSLYGINSVFRKKQAFGTDPAAFSVTPGAYALRGDTKIEIGQIAQAHSVASRSFDPATTLKAGTLGLTVGSNTGSVVFNGGSVVDLADAVNRQFGRYLSASVVRDTANTVVFCLTSKLSGEQNEIGLTDPDGVLSTLPFVEKKKVSVFGVNQANGFLEPSWQKYRGSDAKLITLQGGLQSEGNELVLSSACQELAFDTLTVDSSYKLEITYRVKARPQPVPGAAAGQTGDANQVFSSLFSAFVKDIEVKGVPFPVNDQNRVEEPVETPAPAGPDIGAGVAYASGTRTEKLKGLDPSTNAVTAILDLDASAGKINRLILWSAADGQDLAVQSVRIYSKRQKDTGFARTLQEPRDAKFKINDIDIQRPNNTGINDVIRDVSIDLKAPTEKPVTFTVDYAYDDIALKLTSFVSNYNDVLGFINDVQKTSVSDKPGDYDKADRGVFSGDMAFATIKSKLRSLVSAPYPTSLSNRMALLFQIGVSTGEWGSAVEDTRGGRLKYNRPKFEENFRQYPEAVQELFSSDTDGDKKPNEGMAFRMDLFLADVVRPRSGIVDLKIEKTKEDLRQKDKQIAGKEEQTKNYENRLKEQFQNMDKNMADLKAQERWLRMNTESQKKDQ